MAIQGVETKCYILALFVRDDDERFLLGSGHYEFKDSQKQFSANTIQNDVVEVQGNDGFLLAGQVRRPGTQSFDGYIGDGTTEKTEVEEYRRQFFGFFRKNHFYRVIYVFPDGSAIQRKRGFLVDDPTVEELYQQYPEYHVALNFEDVNYYTYSENEQGEEIYAEEAQIDLSSMVATGGLVWDEYGAVNQGYAWGGEMTASGTEFTVQNDLSLPAPITDTKLNGDTYQQTYSGKNLLNIPDGTFSQNGITWTRSGNIANGSGIATSTYCDLFYDTEYSLPAGTYTFSIQESISQRVTLYLRDASNNRHSYNINAGNTSVTFTTNYDAVKQHVTLAGFSSGDTIDVSLALQLEAGSTATAFEPYVGGTPSPNPDYPQDVNVVTGEQTVAVNGKNLFNNSQEAVYNLGTSASPITSGIRVTSTEVRSNSFAVFKLFKSSDFLNKSITLSTNITPSAMNQPNAYIGLCDVNGGNRVAKVFMTGAGEKSVTYTHTEENASSPYIMVALYSNSSSRTVQIGDYVDYANLQLEVGSTATDYEPYQTPQSYTVDLGSTELCKLGDYQDYIYKGADGWYVHKALGKSELGSLTWLAGRTSTSGVYRMYTNGLNGLYVAPPDNNTAGVGLCSHFLITADNTTMGSYGSHISLNLARNGDTIFAFHPDYTASNSGSDFKTWLTNNNVVLYYALSTPTDTQITDTTLSSQLDALGSAKLMVGENNVLVSASGANLPAELQIKYYSTVSFDGAGFVWEEGGSGGPTTVQIDSITNVYPIWKVKGPAVNPELSVITTNTTLKYEGSVGANQTLVIDMMNKTAKINGTSVIGNVTGDWVNFTPGINRVVYITDNADTPPSLIEWQEVVG